MSKQWRRQFASLLLVVTFSVAMISVAQAATAPPNILSYQGRLLNANGVPVTSATASMKFMLYDSASGGTCLWSNSSSTCASQTARTVTLSSGLFSENLGDTDASYAIIPSTVFADNQAVYLGITIGADSEMTPRKRMTAAPYALNAQTLDGIDSTSFLQTGTAIAGASPLVFEGATDDTFETTFAITDPTADNTITFKNASGTVAFLSDIGGVTADSLDFTDFVDSMTLDAATTISGNILSFNTNSDFAVNINTGTSTGSLSLGGGFGTVAINSSDWDIDVTGNISGINSLSVNPSTTPTDDLVSINNSFAATSTGDTSALHIAWAAQDASTSGIDIEIDHYGSATDGLIMDGVKIIPETLSNVAGVDYFNGIRLMNPTGDPGATIDSTGLVIQDGYDQSMKLHGATPKIRLDNAGALTFIDASSNTLMTLTDSGTSGTLSVGDFSCTDCLDFADFADSMTLDATTTIQAPAATGLRLTGTAAPTVDLFSLSTGVFGSSTNDVDGFSLTFESRANNSHAFNIIPTFNDGFAGSLNFSALNITDISATGQAAGNTVQGIEIGDVSEGGAMGVTSSALKIGGGWDSALFFSNTASNITIADTGVYTFNNFSDSTLMTLTDNGGAGDLLLSGDLTLNGGDFDVTLNAGDGASITSNASSTATTLTLTQTTTANNTMGLFVNATQQDGTTAGENLYGGYFRMTGNDADGDMYGLFVEGVATINATAGTYEAGIIVDNQEDTAGSMLDGILIFSTGIDGGITDGIDVSDSNITNALNFGTNIILGTTGDIDMTNFDVVGSSGDITTAGDIAINGGDITTTSAIFNLANAATTLNLGSSNIAREINIGTGSAIDTINIGTGGTGVDLISIGSADTAWSIDATGATTGLSGITVSGNLTDILDITMTDGVAHTIGVDVSSTTTSALSIVGQRTTAANTGGALNLTGGQSAGGGAAGGAVTITGGASGTTGGAVNINGGTGGNGGWVTMSGGQIWMDASMGSDRQIHIGNGATYSTSVGNASYSTTITSNLWSIDSSGLITSANDLALNGGDLTTTSATFNLANAATTLNLGSTNVARAINIGTGTAADTINIGTENTSTDTIKIGSNSTLSSLSLRAGAGSGVFINAELGGTTNTYIGGMGADIIAIASGSAAAGDTITIGNPHASTTVEITGGDDWNMSAGGFLTVGDGQGVDIVSGGTQGLSIGYTNATLINVGSQAATNINIGNKNISDTVGMTRIIRIGDESSTHTINLGGTGTYDGTDTVNIATNSTTADIINIGNNNASTLIRMYAGFMDLNDVTGTKTTDIGGVNNDGADTINIATENTSADTIKIGSNNASSSLSLRAGSSSGIYINAELNGTTKTYVGGTGADTIEMAIDNTTADTLTIGNTNTGTTLALTGGDDWSILTTGALSIGVGGKFTVAATGIAAVNLNGTVTTNGLCHSGANVDVATDTTRDIVACSGAPGDYAEWHETDGTVQSGDIVSTTNGIFTYSASESNAFTGEILAEKTQKTLPILTAATASQSENVLGVVSTSPNQTIGSDVRDQGAHPQPIALVGRVPVNVTNENGSIQVGDYITTSTTPGKGMKATYAGRVIGIALTGMNGASGQVTVQVTNSWYFGSLIGNDGTSTLLTDNVVVAPIGNASASTQTFDSYGLALRGSAWDGNQAQAVSMMFKNKVTDGTNYRLSVRNTLDSEVAYITNTGTMQVAGDMVVGGKIYPSNLGGIQTDKYIYYDGSAGPGGDFMRTNASGWSTGSYDFAEMFPSSEVLVAGDVVVFSSTNIHVKRSTKKDEKSIAGIVSTRPGFLAGENTPGSYPIALAGRVPTNVNNENGAIAVGDPLTTSSTTGFAMKATKAGPIVGYALEPFDGNAGKITVFVSAGYWGGDATSSTPGADNRASLFGSSGNSSMSTLSMGGNINMNGNEISNIGRMSGLTNSWSIEMDGTIKTEALLKTVIIGQNNQKVETIATTSPEAVITLSGSSTLKEGMAEVRFFEINKDFGNVISAIAPIRVVATPNGPVSLYVSEKDQNHFIVKSFGGNASDVEFDWVVTGYRKGFEPVVEETKPAPVANPVQQSAPSVTLTETVDSIETTISTPTVTESASTPVVTESAPIPAVVEEESPVNTQTQSESSADVSPSEVPASSPSASTTTVDSSVTNVDATAPTLSP